MTLSKTITRRGVVILLLLLAGSTIFFIGCSNSNNSDSKSNKVVISETTSESLGSTNKTIATSPTATKTPAPTPTKTPAIKPTPTKTPTTIPTFTSIPPVDTPVATDTPAITPSPLPTDTPTPALPSDTPTFTLIPAPRVELLYSLADLGVDRRPIGGPGVLGVTNVSFSPDGTILAVASHDGAEREGSSGPINLRRAADGEFLGKLDWTGWLPHQAAFSPDGTVLAGGLRSRSSQPALVALWQVSDWTLFRVLEDFSDDLMVNKLIFTPDGTTLIAGAPDGIVRLWQVKEGPVTPVQTFNGYHAALSPDGQFLATTQSDGTIQILQPFGGGLLHTLTGHEPQANTVAFSPDGTLLASGGRDNTIRLWDVASGTLIDTLEGHTNHVQSVAFSPDGALLASGSQDSTVRLWNVADGTLLNTLDDHTATVWTVAWSPDGTTLASGSHDGTTKVWQVQTE